MPVRYPRAASLIPALLASAAGSSFALAAGPFGAVVNLSTLNGTTGFTLNGIDANDQSGISVSSAGDVNGDGYDDLIVGAIFADPNGQSSAGETYIVFGKATPFAPSMNLSTLNGTTGFVLNGIDGSDQSGFSVASAGDINGDGYDDLIVGAPAADPNGQGSAGETYIVFGKGTPFAPSLNLSTLNGTTGFVINGIDANDNSGSSVASAGDINGDGYADLIIGATSGDPNGQSGAGESYVVFGKPSGFAASLDLSSLNGTTGFVINGIDVSDNSGGSVASAGDINGDGYADAIIGARNADPNGQYGAGESYVVFGKPSGFAASLNLSSLNGTTGFVVNGIDGADASGASVSSAGDINGDGYDDLIIGARYADPNGQSGAGESYVVFGKPSGFAASLDLSTLNGTTGFVVSGIDANDTSGSSVASAGDVNGDGLDDLIIGARFVDPNGQASAGSSHVVFGKPSGFAASLNLSSLNGVNGFVLNGIDAYDNSGFSVAGAGDVNGDGIDDLIIGARYADPNGQSGAGESYVVYGRPGQVWDRTTGGSWSTASNWLSAAVPSGGIVQLEPRFGGTITGPSSFADLKSLTIDSELGLTILDLRAGSTLIVEQAITLSDHAAIAGLGTLATLSPIFNSGTIIMDDLSIVADGPVINQPEGDITVNMGFIAADLDNAGLIDISPDTAGGPASLDILGTIDNNAGGLIALRDGVIDLTATETIRNQGQLAILNTEAAIFADIDNSGAIELLLDSTALFFGDIFSSGAITVAPGSTLAILGDYAGPGVVGISGPGSAGPAYLAAAFSPAAQSDIATASFDGDLTLGNAAITTIEIGGPAPGIAVGGHDQITISGAFDPAGTLRIVTTNGYLPPSGAAYDLLNFTSVLGAFNTIELDTVLTARSADTSTLLIDGILRIPTAPACAGDINGDLSTNAADFTILAGNFGASVAQNTNGDLNGDGLVNAADFVILAGDFGCAP
jgi:hypothetical protein